MNSLSALGLNDLAEVVNEVFDARAKWYDIGLNLKVPVSTLETIRAQYRDNPQDCLREMLMVWLKMDPQPTWKALVDALRRRMVGEARLADVLEAKWCPKLDTKPVSGII